MLEHVGVLEEAWRITTSGKVTTNLHVFHFPAQLATEFNEWFQIRQKHHAYSASLGTSGDGHDAKNLTSIASRSLFSTKTSSTCEEGHPTDQSVEACVVLQDDGGSQARSETASVDSIASSRDAGEFVTRRRHSWSGSHLRIDDMGGSLKM
jgi:hypothetical protein